MSKKTFQPGQRANKEKKAVKELGERNGQIWNQRIWHLFHLVTKYRATTQRIMDPPPWKKRMVGLFRQKNCATKSPHACVLSAAALYLTTTPSRQQNTATLCHLATGPRYRCANGSIPLQGQCMNERAFRVLKGKSTSLYKAKLLGKPVCQELSCCQITTSPGYPAT